MEIGSLTYGHAVATPLPFEAAVARTKELLKEHGFGVLCEIDVAKTLREKTGAAFRPYIILGACNPQFARRALEAEAQLGLLLPCNVVVQERDGQSIVSAIDAPSMMAVVGNSTLAEIASEVQSHLDRVLADVAKT